MTARSFIIAFALGVLITPLAAEVQPSANLPRIGILLTGAPPPAPDHSMSLEAFRQGLRDLGYVEGQTIILEFRYAEGRFERLLGLTAELVHLKVDILVTGGAQPVQVLKQATSTILIVGGALADPVGTGFSTSFARSGGNITGLAFQNADLSTKRLELLKRAKAGPNTAEHSRR